ncbi:general secretion pathway protein GspB [Xylophilus sp.]|uniref:general secretion pathway protein GspB n=1 Tax=Xylophilus sp. TaxID=2653893 RepID=UPI0013BB20F9|nr:general secretion pathway protein GspB [Xylophilus sp.]KAF1045015.1 MAG: General secretion pathway protein B [Xylophilus sp.]
MSYILDALRRAEAERSRGALPGVHTPVPPAAAVLPAQGRPTVLRPAAAMAAAGVLAALAAAAWWSAHRPGTGPAAATVAQPPATAPDHAMPAAPQPAQAEPPPAAKPRVRPVPAPPAQRPAAPKPTPPPPSPAAPAPAAEAVGFARDVPESVRRQLPNLQVSGVSYSSNPQHRMAIVNGQVLREGDAGAPGLVLERIEPQQTVWTFGGYRYAVPMH